MSNAICVGCLTGYDVGLADSNIAYPHPDCPEHGAQKETPKTFLLERLSPVSMKNNTMEFPISLQGEINSWLQYGGSHIQEAFPSLTPDQREFLITGITPEEWNEMFSEEEEW